jgi:hypothetical protein
MVMQGKTETHGKTETILAVIPGERPQDRLVLAMVGADADKPLVLRTESFSPDVGWFVQSSVSMSRAELAGLKNVLGLTMSRGCQQTAGRVQQSQRDDEPCVLPFARRRA